MVARTPRPASAAAGARAALQAHALELLACLGDVRARRMFGGAGVYAGDQIMALILGEVLYLKADAQAQPAFVAAGSQPFSYSTKDGRRQLTSYWSAPDEAMESPAQMRPWALLALDSALRAAAAKRQAAAPRPQASRRQPKASRPGAGAAAKAGTAARSGKAAKPGKAG